MDVKHKMSYYYLWYSKILATALPLATTPVNTEAGFSVSWIYSLNTEIFQDEDFMPSYVTDRTAPMTSNQTLKLLPNFKSFNSVIFWTYSIHFHSNVFTLEKPIPDHFHSNVIPNTEGVHSFEKVMAIYENLTNSPVKNVLKAE